MPLIKSLQDFILFIVLYMLFFCTAFLTFFFFSVIFII